MKSIQSKNSTPANYNHSPFFKKESGNSLFVKNEKPFFNASPIQAKLTVNQPNDPYEKEADAVADKVIQRLNNKSFPNTENNQAAFFRKSSEPIQRQCAACGKKEKVQKKEQEDENDLQKSISKGNLFSKVMPNPRKMKIYGVSVQLVKRKISCKKSLNHLFRLHHRISKRA